MNPDLSQQVAIVTGAGRGIGKAVARSLAAAGASVVLAARSETELRQLQDEIGERASSVVTDVSVEADVLRLFDHVRQTFGRLDILINNAGIGRFGPIQDFATKDFDDVIGVNLRGTFLCCREAVKLMLPHKSGTIINIASVVGFKGYPQQAAYTASKHGVMGLTKAIAAEVYQHGIRVSAILPGGVDTDMVGHARPDLDRSVLLTPQDIAQSVMYLLSLSPKAAIDQIYIHRRNSAPF
jgi:3-oxoacyl-[acyl-carrier protein] reductase